MNKHSLKSGLLFATFAVITMAALSILFVGAIANGQEESPKVTSPCETGPFQPAGISDPGQWDGATSISEGWIVRHPYISSFSAGVFTHPCDLYGALQVELRRFEEPFTGVDDGGIFTSDPVPSGQVARIPEWQSSCGCRPPILLPDGKYHWRARAVNNQGNASPWVEFGVAGNVDFEIITNRPPTLSYSQEPDYIDDGINPDEGHTDTNFAFKIVYTDADNDPPTEIRTVVVDGAPSDFVAVMISNDAMVLDSSASPELRDGNYTNGEQYTLNKRFPVAGHYRYYFRAFFAGAEMEGMFFGGIAGGKEQRFEVVARIKVKIDIKPGSFPNSINLKSKGVIPVAVFGTNEFNVSSIDPATVTLSGAPIKLAANSKPIFSIKDVDGDGLADLMAHMNSADLRLNSGDTTATLVGKTFDGIIIYGIDSVKIVP